MLDGKYLRGFTLERLNSVSEPKVHSDSEGYYIYTLSENIKVYFDDYYNFLKNVYSKCLKSMSLIDEKLETTPTERRETISFYRAQKTILEIVMRTTRSFYMDNSTFDVIMTP